MIYDNEELINKLIDEEDRRQFIILTNNIASELTTKELIEITAIYMRVLERMVKKNSSKKNVICI